MNYNLNTYLLLLTIVSGFVWAGVQWQDQNSTNKEFRGWITRHETQHKERQVQIEAGFARMDQRVNKLEVDSLKMDNINYRITVNEQAVLAINRLLDEIRNGLADLGSDVRVMREVVVPGSSPPRQRR